MAKGLFTQGMCVLVRQGVAVSELEARLKDFQLIGRTEPGDSGETHETLVYNYRAEVGGHLLVTASDSPWPDEMGDPDESPELFVAWSLGQFGPLAFPGCLKRACDQAWGWDNAAETVLAHRAHVRLLISYVLGGDEAEENGDDEDLPLVPDDYDALDELKFLTKAVESLLDLPEAICYFNPGGEVLRDEHGLRQGLNSAWNHDIPPLDMWTNVRLFRAVEGWSLMDTVGNGQIDLPDMEAIYIADKYEPAEVEEFLRNASLYLLNKDEDVDDGDTADGPGGITWSAMECNDALTDPPRPTIRWIPDDETDPPAELLEIGEADEDDDDEGDDDQYFDEDEDEFDDEDYDDDDLATGFGDSSSAPISDKPFGSDLFTSDMLDEILDDELDEDIEEDK